MKPFAQFLLPALLFSVLASCGTSSVPPVSSNTSLSSVVSSVDNTKFEVGADRVTAKTEGSTEYAPTFKVNVKIVGGEKENYFNGIVTLTSDKMWASEFTAEAIADKGLSQEGIAQGFVTTIGDYTGGQVGELYYYWSYTVNGVVANWGCNAYQMRDGDYLLWEFVSYKS